MYNRTETSELPVCVNNLLDKREYLYEKSQGIFDNVNGPYSCRLLKYTAERVVTCVDVLYQELINARNQSDDTKQTNNIPGQLHFVFMGDSRIRQQFFNFLQVTIYLILIRITSLI